MEDSSIFVPADGVYLGETDRFMFYLRGSFPDLHVRDKDGLLVEENKFRYSEKFKGMVVDHLAKCCDKFKELRDEFNDIVLVRAELGMQSNDKAVFESMVGFRYDDSDLIGPCDKRDNAQAYNVSPMLLVRLANKKRR